MITIFSTVIMMIFIIGIAVEMYIHLFIRMVLNSNNQPADISHPLRQCGASLSSMVCIPTGTRFLAPCVPDSKT